jgi:hypothetical protein
LYDAMQVPTWWAYRNLAMVRPPRQNKCNLQILIISIGWSFWEAQPTRFFFIFFPSFFHFRSGFRLFFYFFSFSLLVFLLYVSIFPYTKFIF